MPTKKSKYNRVMLKLSGEVFADKKGQSIDQEAVLSVAKQIAELKKKGFQMVIVNGAGNLWRYRDNQSMKMERVTSDYMGMVATVMNAVALENALHQVNCPAVVMSALDLPHLAESYIKRYAMEALEFGEVVICAGGTGNPYFTTDSAAALRAIELECDVILKATKVDGVYSADPKKNPKAKRYESLSYNQAIDANLQVMDQSAFSLCRENKIKMVVFDMYQKNAILKAAMGEKIGTIIS